MSLIRIQRGMKVCPLSTKALLMAMVVQPCVTSGEKIFEETEEVNWQKEMREWTWAHKEQMKMVHEAQIAETDDAIRKGRASSYWPSYFFSLYREKILVLARSP